MSKNHCKNWFLTLSFLFGVYLSSSAQTTDTTQTKHYTIEIAGIKVGTMSAIRQPKDNQTVLYSIISDVKVNLLIYKINVYYKEVTLFREDKLITSTVEARSNKGNYLTTTKWKGDHYEIVASQYKYSRKATDKQPITYSLNHIYFNEPVGRSRVYSEYFGNYFMFSSPEKNNYIARINEREDEYFYEKGELVKIVKKNALKNFIIRPVK